LRCDAVRCSGHLKRTGLRAHAERERSDHAIRVYAALQPDHPGGVSGVVARGNPIRPDTRVAVDTRPRELEAERLRRDDRDSIRAGRKMFHDARPRLEAGCRYANDRSVRYRCPCLQVTDARGRRTCSNDAERKHGGRGRQSCDSSDDGKNGNAPRGLPKVGSRATLTVRL
jgi:hypothetical protein